MIRRFLSLFGPRCDFGRAGANPCRLRARWSSVSGFGWCAEHRGPDDVPLGHVEPEDAWPRR